MSTSIPVMESVTDAVSVALKQHKPLIVIANDKTNDSTWAYEYLLTPEVHELIKSGQAVVLRIAAGSQDFLNFTRIFKVRGLPAIFVIDNGVAQVDIFRGGENTNLTDFTARVVAVAKVAETRRATQSGAGSSSSSGTTAATAATATSTATVSASASASTANTGTSSTTTLSSVETSRAPSVTASATPSSATNAPAAANNTPQLTSSSSSSSSTPSSSSSSSHKNNHDDDIDKQEKSAQRYREALQKKKRDELDERARIRKLLETDRKERQSRESYNRSLHHEEEPKNIPPSPEATPTLVASRSIHCALLIRLFDGQPMKHRFAATDSLATVRSWVNAEASPAAGLNDTPYTFFDPLARRTFNESDEDTGRTLADLGLTPSATLVLKPVRGHVSSAYGRDGGGAIGGGSGFRPYALVGNGVRSVFGALSGFLGYGGANTNDGNEAEQEPLHAGDHLLSERDSTEHGNDERFGEEGSGHGGISQNSSHEGHNTHDSVAGLTRRYGNIHEAHGSNSNLHSRFTGFSGTTTPSGLSTRYNSVASFHDLAVAEAAAAAAAAAASSGSSTGSGSSGSSAASGTGEGDSDDKRKKADRITYNGNNLSLEDYGDDHANE
ncbi:uncharacterized protein SAPINGB_P002420 [Magnusiomyces paraingens]|uniref:UBX domain-containing protein n=1 Tax=Magnusiomyces paraingens TaxID=2606893 RepID=A0A5E8BFW9_9ASCO|nr:uncharacterized protein SAPINGB_P002420 [Saprochaete ingens]VVT49741.1 unnamed protein product [Saprochaete ingens]